MVKEKITPEYVKKNMQTGKITLPDSIEDEFGNIHNINEDINLADKEIDDRKLAKNDINVTFRWSKNEVERCKRLATQKGLRYQAYIKSLLKQAMDKEESA